MFKCEHHWGHLIQTDVICSYQKQKAEVVMKSSGGHQDIIRLDLAPVAWMWVSAR